MLLIRPRTIFFGFGLALILIGLGTLFAEFRDESQAAKEEFDLRVAQLNAPWESHDVSGGSAAVSAAAKLTSENASFLRQHSFWFVAVGCGVALLSVLWNVSSLSKDWLTSVGFAFKGLGALALLVVAQWFQTQANERTSLLAYAELAQRRQFYEREAATQDRQEQEQERERARLEQERLAERSEKLVAGYHQQLNASKDDSERSRVARAIYSEIQQGDPAAFDCLELLHGMVLDSSHEEVASDQKQFGLKIAKLLFPDLSALDEYPTDSLFVHALDRRMQHHVANRVPQGEEQQGNISTRERDILIVYYNTLSGLTGSHRRNFAGVIDGMKQNADLVAKLEPKDSIEDRVSQVAKAADPESGPLNITGAELDKAVNLLPDYTIGKLPARIYLHAPRDFAYSEKSIETINRIKSQILEGKAKIILPETTIIEDVGGKIPSATSVRYYRSPDSDTEERSRKYAESILKIVKTELDSAAELYAIKPTAQDLRVSRGLENKFEVWFSSEARIGE